MGKFHAYPLTVAKTLLRNRLEPAPPSLAREHRGKSLLLSRFLGIECWPIFPRWSRFPLFRARNPMADTTLMDKLVSLCKRRGFVFQSSEIYGGLGSVWDYGPLGVELKKNVKDRWWRAMVQARDDIEGLDAAILMLPPPVFPRRIL